MAQGVKNYFDLTNSQYGITLRVHYSQTYEIETNSSAVAITNVQVKSSSNKGFLRYLDGSITVGGSTAVSMSSYSGTHSIYVDALNTFYDVSGSMGSVSGITHNNDGSKSVTISVSIDSFRDTGKADWSISGSKVIVLTTIPRVSSFTISAGTLGVAQTIEVTRQSTDFSHTITYKCGSASGTICTKSTSESISFTPPINLASQNTNGTSLTMTVTLQTYSGDTAIGSAVSKSVAMAIPASVKPVCSLSFMDATGNVNRFGGYVQGESQLMVALVGTPAYGSPIASYKTVVNGVTYTNQDFTTGALTNAGEQTITATVKDERGRTSDAVTETFTVLAYTPPKITALSVHRCNEDGTENSTGSFAKVTYSYSITSLSDKNGKNITLRYKKSADSAYTPVVLESVYSASNASYIFAADDGSSYDVSLEVADTLNTSQKAASVSTADVIMHFRSDAKGMGLGKVSEKANALDMGWDIELNDHNLLKNGDPAFAPAGYGLGEAKFISMADIDSITAPGWYYSNESATLGGYTSNRWWIQVLAYGSGTTFATQRIITFNSGLGYELVRHKINGTWGEMEWVNPPMVRNTEYRTVERYMGQPVYTILSYYGYAAAGTQTIPHGISGMVHPISIEVLNDSYGPVTNSLECSSGFDRTNVTISHSSWAMGGMSYILKYTKS